MDQERYEFYRRWHRLAKPYFAWQVEQFEGHLGNRIADVGCGPGNYASVLNDRDLYLAVDIDPDMIALVNDEFGAIPSVRAICGDITDPNFAEILKEYKIETIVSANLIEHIEDDGTALSMMSEVLSPGGTLCLLVPAFQFLFGTLDTLDGHYRRYTKSLLLERMSHLPMEVVRLHYFNSAGALGWWYKGRVRKATRQEDENYAVMNKIIPLLRQLERAVKPPIGLSLIAVFRRR